MLQWLMYKMNTSCIILLDTPIITIKGFRERFRKERLMSAHALSPFRLERWFVEFEFIPGIRNLTASGPFDATTQELLALEEGTTERYLNLGLGYIENPGKESLRQAVSSLYTTLKAEDIQITSGASEALFLLSWLVMEPGANIVVEEPCYENLPGVASALSFEVRRLPLHMEDGWKPNLEQLAHLIDERTRLIYLVHPHNPTGSTLQVEEMQEIARMAERVGALVVNDELFRLIALDGEPTPSIIDVAENAICLGDMSKPWGLGGLRIGWIASRDHHLLQRMSEARDYSTMCSSTPGEFLAEVALRHSSQLIAPRLAAARANREQLAEVIAKAKAHFHELPAWHRPQASYTAFVQLPFPAEAFCRHLALERHIFLLPGSVFGPAYENFIRVGLGGDTLQFREGMSIMLDELLRWRER
jgi:aspartate/methionine/tyrosine aminotransferase